jgi:hypothetical protein
MGQWKRGKKHDLGIRTWPEGQIYSGNWSDGKMNGFGTFSWPSGLFYMGKWKEHKRDGLGVEMHRDSTTNHHYCGMWKAGKRHGYGERSKREAGQIWAGAFEHGDRVRPFSEESRQMAWEAAQSSIPVAQKSLLLAKQSLEMVGKYFLKKMYRAKSTHDLLVELNCISSLIMDKNMCRIPVRDLLEIIHDWKRNEEKEWRNDVKNNSGNDEKKYNNDTTVDDATFHAAFISKWNKSISLLFGKVLKECRQMEKYHLMYDRHLMSTLQSFQDLSTMLWEASGGNSVKEDEAEVPGTGSIV